MMCAAEPITAVLSILTSESIQMMCYEHFTSKHNMEWHTFKSFTETKESSVTEYQNLSVLKNELVSSSKKCLYMYTPICKV